ncbi:FecR domain-containing protein [Methylobacillus glycogenes]|uniref:FecR domain-containing protein n=1 Tax=Methylobacillus glycogenes TaxID=406 RepID=UPI00046FCDEA|nr:FecR family protein [Methylobacillus glycogenes]
MHPDQRVVEEAIAWMVTLQSGHASTEDHAACLRWQAQHPQHKLAWERLRDLSQPMQQVAPAPAIKHLAMQTLADNARTEQKVQALMQRRQALKLLLLVSGSAGLLGLGYKQLPWQPMLAQYTTRVGQNKRVMLADGTELLLNTATALDSDFDASTRRLRFYHGEVLLTTGHESPAQQANTAHRPFIVETAQGSLRALGTRFLVRQREQGIGLAVFEGAVEVNNGAQRQIVQAGQQLEFSRASIGAVQSLNPDASAWVDGLLIARAMPLGQFLQELNRYRRGHISCDPALAQLTISGVFPLQQPERVLQAVQETLPVRVVQYWHYWVRVLPPAAQA